LPGTLFLPAHTCFLRLINQSTLLFLIQRAVAELNFLQEKLQVETDRRHTCEIRLDDQEEAAADWRAACLVLVALVRVDLCFRVWWRKYRQGEPPLDRYILCYIPCFLSSILLSPCTLTAVAVLYALSIRL
jgi:hypothetical protein